MEKLNKTSKQVLIGSMFGDGYVIKNGTNCYFEEIHSIKQKEYLAWKQMYVPNSKLSHKVYNNYKLGKKYEQTRLKTPNNPTFTALRKIFYPNGKKIVPKTTLNQIDKLGLTVWYLDDGYVNLLSNLVNISTDCYSLDENYLIKDFLEKKWKIKTKVSKRNKNHYLTFDVEASNKLLGIVEETFKKYDLPNSLKYKLGRSWEGNQKKLKEHRNKRNEYKRKWRAKKREIRLKEKAKKDKTKLYKIKKSYYKQKKSLYEVAKELGYKNHVTILNIMKKAGLKRRSLSEACSGEKNGFFGRKHSKETKEKISKSRKKVGE